MISLNTRQLKRIDSDKRIIEAAYQVFALNGFTFTKLSDVAKVAGVSQGLISQRFDKDELFNKLVNDFCSNFISLIYRATNIKDTLCTIIDVCKDYAKNDPDRFLFMEVLINSTDFPNNIKENIKSHFNSSSLYELFRKALVNEEINGNNAYETFKLFVQTTISIIKCYSTSNQSIPSDDYILGLIGFKRDDGLNIYAPVNKEAVLLSFLNDYEVIFSFDVRTDKIHFYQTAGFASDWIKDASIDGSESFKLKYAKTFVHPDDRDEFILQTKNERIIEELNKNENYIVNHRIIINGNIIYRQTKFTKDITSNDPSVILCGDHNVDDSTKKDLYKQSLINDLASNLDGAFQINLDTGEEEIVVRRGIYKLLPSDHFRRSSFDERSARFVKYAVADSDQERYAEYINKANILKNIKQGNTDMRITYQTRLENNEYYQTIIILNTIKDQGNWITLGIKNVDKDYRINSKMIELESESQKDTIIQSLSDNYDLVYYVNLENREVSFINVNDSFNKLLSQYDDAMPTYSKIDNMYRKIVTKDFDRFMLNTALRKVKEKLSTDTSYSYEFNAEIDGKEEKYRVKFVVNKGNANGIVVGLNKINSDVVYKASNSELEKALKEELNDISTQLSITKIFSGVLLESLVSAYYINLTDLSVVVYQRNEFLTSKYAHITNYLESINQYIATDVHALDRNIMYQVIKPDYLRSRLKYENQFRINFRDISNNKVKYYRLQVIKGYDEDHCVFCFTDISAKINEQSAKDATQAIMDIVLSNYNSVFKANLDLDEATFYRKNKYDYLFLNDETTTNYSKLIEWSTTNYVYKDDIERMRRILSIEYLKDHLSIVNNFNKTFSSVVNGELHRFKVNVTKLNEKECLIGIADKNEEMIRDMAQESLIEDYSIVYVIDARYNSYRVLRAPAGYGKLTGNVGKYPDLVEGLKKIIDGDYVAYLNSISSIESLVKFVEADDMREFNYKVKGSINQWQRCNIRVIEKNALEPTLIVMSIKDMDQYSSKDLEYQEKLNDSVSIITALSDEYDYICYVDINQQELFSYRMSDKIASIYDSLDYSLPARHKIDKLMNLTVCKEDYEEFRKATDYSYIVNYLKENPMYLYNFRMDFGDGPLHYQLKVVYNTSYGGLYVIALKNCESEYVQKQNELRSDEIMKVLLSQYVALFYVDFITGKYEVHSSSRYMVPTIQKAISLEKDIKSVMVSFINNFVYPEDQNKVLTLLARIKEIMAHKKYHKITLRIKYADKYMYSDLTCMKVGTIDDKPTSMVFGFENKDEEYRKNN